MIETGWVILSLLKDSLSKIMFQIYLSEAGAGCRS